MIITPSYPYNNNNFLGGKTLKKEKHVHNPFYCNVTEFILELVISDHYMTHSRGGNLLKRYFRVITF